MTEGNVLIAEEAPLCRRFLEMALTADGYRVVAQTTHVGALRELQERGSQYFECVVTDYLCYGVPNTDLIAHIKQVDPALSVVMFGATSAENPALQSLRMGACAFLEKPLSRDRLRQAVASAISKTARKRRGERMHGKIDAVALLQKRLLDGAIAADGVSVDAFFRPKEITGGDALRHFRLAGGQDVLLITDVSGHELDSALVSAFTGGILRGLTERGVPLTEVLQACNRALMITPGVCDASFSLAVCALRFDYANNRMTTLLSGSPAPAWINRHERVEVWAGSPSPPLGWFPDAQPAVVDSPLPCGPIWIWTDGVEDLAAQIGAHPVSVAVALVKATRDGSEPEWIAAARDDVLAICFWPASAKRSAEYIKPIFYASYTRQDLRQVDSLQDMWRRSLELAAPSTSAETIFDMLLASREALLNALHHGCTGDQEVKFQITHSPRQRSLTVHLDDPGCGYIAEPLHDRHEPGTLADGHRGLLLMQQLAASIDFSNNGASVKMTFHEGDQEHERDIQRNHEHRTPIAV